MRLRAIPIQLAMCLAITLGVSSHALGEGVNTLRHLASPALTRIDHKILDYQLELAYLPQVRPRAQASLFGYRSEPTASADEAKWVQVDLLEPTAIDTIALVPAHLASAPHPGPGFGFPVRFKVELSDDEEFAVSSVVADYSKQDFANPGLSPVLLTAKGQTGRYVRVTATKLWSRGDEFLFALGELVVVSGTRNVAQSRPVAASDSADLSDVWAARMLTDGMSVLGRPTDQHDLPSNGYHSKVSLLADTEKWVQVDLGKVIKLDRLRLRAARPIDFPDTAGFGFPTRFRIETSSDAEFANPELLADHTSEDFPNPGDRPVEIDAGGRQARVIRVTATRLWQRSKDWVFALAEFEAWSGGKNVAAGGTVTALDSIRVPRWNEAALVDGIAPNEGSGDYGQWLSGIARAIELTRKIAELRAEQAALIPTADRRLAFAAGTIGLAMLTGLWLWWRSQRRAREREVKLIRERLARDLHDEIGSQLGGLAILSEMALNSATDPVRADLARINETARSAAAALRDIVWLTGPEPTTVAELVTRLRTIAANLTGGLDCRDELQPAAVSVDPRILRELMLVFREALFNVRRHAQAKQVTISLQTTGNWLKLQVSDNGRGLNGHVPSPGHGLDNMRRRAEAIGGRLDIASGVGEGTRVTLEAPLR